MEPHAASDGESQVKVPPSSAAHTELGIHIVKSSLSPAVCSHRASYISFTVISVLCSQTHVISQTNAKFYNQAKNSFQPSTALAFMYPFVILMKFRFCFKWLTILFSPTSQQQLEVILQPNLF